VPVRRCGGDAAGPALAYFGPDALAIPHVARRADPNWKSDLWWQRVRDSRIVEKGVAQKPPLGPTARVMALYDGWAAGYNAYLRSGKLRDPTCKGKPWVKPITRMDLHYRGEQLATSPTSSLFISGLVDAAPPTGGASRARVAGGADLSALTRQLDPPTGLSQSNGASFGSRATRSGGGMVLANPHAPWRGTERWWMVHLKVPGVYDVMGGTLSGYPPIGIGFNRHVAWTHTTSTARRFVLFQLKLVPGDPTSYLVDGRPEKMRQQTVTAAGRTHTFYSAELTAKPLAAACAASPQVTLDDGSTVDIRDACPVLRDYRQTGTLDDPGAWLFNEWIRRAPPFTGALFSDPFDPSRPLDTPRILNTANPAVLQALGAAVKSLRDHGVPLNATLRRTQHAPQSKDIPIHGCWQCFQRVDAANETPISVPGPAGILEHGPYGQVTNGPNMILTIELRKDGPRAEGILAPSQATDRTSPWYANMTRLFSKKGWVRLRFTAGELARDRGARETGLP